MMMSLGIGDTAPDFTAETTDGRMRFLCAIQGGHGSFFRAAR